MDLGIRGKRALVTGAGRGLGRAIAIELAAEGVNIIACSRGEAGLESLMQELGQGQHSAISVDLGKTDASENVIRQVKNSAGSPDIIVETLATLTLLVRFRNGGK